jgi:hypothetical protein
MKPIDIIALSVVLLVFTTLVLMILARLYGDAIMPTWGQYLVATISGICVIGINYGVAKLIKDL